MEKIFIIPRTEIEYIVNESKRWGGRKFKGYFVVGDEGQEVSLEISYKNDGANSSYAGKVKWGTRIDKFAPIKDNADALSWVTDFVIGFYRSVTKRTDFNRGIPVTVID